MHKARLVTLLVLLPLLSLSRAQQGEDFMASLAAERYGESGRASVQSWRQFMQQAKKLDEHQQLEAVNAFFNRLVQYREDSQAWGQNDYWATPLQTMGRRVGDCEDFGIAKYVTLNLLGVPLNRLRLTYVRLEIGLPGSGISQAHMVLAYYQKPEAEPLILDSVIGEMRPASRRPDLKPIYSFNSEGLWVAGRPSPVLANPSSRLSNWRDVLNRMREEGLN